MGWGPLRGRRLRAIEVVGVLPNPPAARVPVNPRVLLPTGKWAVFFTPHFFYQLGRLGRGAREQAALTLRETIC
jgi:hypothetical protein